MVVAGTRFLPGNAQHVGSRGEQQDAFGFSDPGDVELHRHGGFVAVLADGMGGLAAGRTASVAAVKAFLAAYKQKPATESIPDALARAAREANGAVLTIAREAGLAGQMGTTLVAAALADDAMHWISVGDSTLYLLRDGRVALITTPHVYATELDQAVAAGRLSRAAALSDPQRESLTSYLGMAELHEADRSLRPLPIATGDVVLLCSDGLTKTLNDHELGALTRGDPQQMAEALVAQALAKQREHQDNLTVLTVAIAAGSPSAAGSRRRSSRRAWGWGAVAAAALLAGGAAAWRFQPPPPQTVAPSAPMASPISTPPGTPAPAPATSPEPAGPPGERSPAGR